MWWHDAERPDDEGYVRHLSLVEMVRRVAPLFRPHLHLLLIGLGLMLVGVAAELAGPLVLKILIDVFISAGAVDGILLCGAVYGVLFLIGAASRYFHVVVLTRMGLEIVTALKERLFDHLLGLSLAYFDKNSSGKLLARVESDSERLQALFSEVALSMLRTLLLLTGTFVVMFVVNWRIAAGFLALTLLLATTALLYFRWMRGFFRRVRAIYARISAFVTEYVQGVPVLQVFGYERRARDRMAALNDEKIAIERKTAVLEYGFWGLLMTMEIIVVGAVVWAAGGEALRTTITIGTFVLFADYARRIFWPLAMFSEQLNFIQRAFASADRVFDVLDTPSRTPDRADARDTVPDTWREVRFEDVSFVYDGGTRALDQVSFGVRRGERVALVGVSGGGKTTITNLLLRFYEPTEGSVTLDGTDIRDFRQKAWRARIGLVQQDIHLFPGAIDENLRALVDEIPQEDLERAVAVVGAEEVIARQPKGYREVLAEGGTNLSMGERQLLSFARAVVRDPDLLVLDEATSSVDPATERRLQDSVERLMAGRTALIIAHRLSTVVNADRILVMHRGRLVEEGTHAELYAQGGIYRDLFDLQFRAEESA